MAAAAPLTNFTCTPDPENPGWLHWRLADDDRFNGAVLGKLIARVEGANTCRIRLVPQVPLHTNSGGHVHGGITLSLIDVSIFAAAYMVAGIDAGRSVTLEITNQFIASGDASRPLDSVVEVLRETGRLVFVRGLVKQDDDLVASFTATARKPSQARAG